MMKKMDNRKLSQVEQEKFRRAIIHFRSYGLPNTVIAESLHTSASYVSTIYRKFEKYGFNAIVRKDTNRGRRVGECRVLNHEQESEIKRVVIHETPNESNLNFKLWSRRVVHELIKRRFQLDIPLRTLTDYLSRWEFTCQKPAINALEQQTEIVQKWLIEEYPRIRAKAKSKNAIIYWISRRRIKNDEYLNKDTEASSYDRTYGMIFATRNNGESRFLLYHGSMNQDRFIDFINRLTMDAGRMVYLIYNDYEVSRGDKVAAWFETNANMVTVFSLPKV